MITIPVSQLKEFFRRSKSIRPNQNIPILSNLKLEAGEACNILKTNLNSYCIHELEAFYPTHFSVLIDEKVLLKVLEQGTDEDIEIKVESGKVLFKCGIVKTGHPLEDENKFPTFPIPRAERKDSAFIEKVSVLTKDVLQSIGTACQTLVQDRDCQISYVHVNGAVFSSDNFSLYLKKLNDSMPDLVLSKECCQIISEYESLQHFEAGNYNFFDTGKTIYGFVKTTHGTPAYQQIFKKVDTDPFEMNREDFVAFCELTSISPAKTPLVEMKGEGSKVVFNLNDTEFGKDANMEFDIEGKVIDTFTFNPKILLPFIKSLPYKRIQLAPIPGTFNYSVTTKEDAAFSGIICGIAK